MIRGVTVRLRWAAIGATIVLGYQIYTDIAPVVKRISLVLQGVERLSILDR